MSMFVVFVASSVAFLSNFDISKLSVSVVLLLVSGMVSPCD